MTGSLPRRTLLLILLLPLTFATSRAEEPKPFSGASVQSEGGLFRVTLRLEEPGAIPLGRFHSWRVRLVDAQGEPVDGARITVGGGMEGHGHGLPTAPKAVGTERAGEYRIDGVKFTMAGTWTLVLVIVSEGAKDTARFPLDVDY